MPITDSLPLSIVIVGNLSMRTRLCSMLFTRIIYWTLQQSSSPQVMLLMVSVSLCSLSSLSLSFSFFLHVFLDPSLKPIPGIKPPPTVVRTKYAMLQNYLIVFPKSNTGETTVNAYTPIVARPGPNWRQVSVSSISSILFFSSIWIWI